MSGHLFQCPICGNEALYYGGDLAICSTGARLSIQDVPKDMVFKVNSLIVRSQITPMGVGFTYTSIVNKNVNAALNNPINIPDPYGRNVIINWNKN